MSMMGGQQRQSQKGQGVIEYAGALVIAAVIISVALITLPEGAYEFLEEIQSSILTMLLGELESMGEGG